MLRPPGLPVGIIWVPMTNKRAARIFRLIKETAAIPVCFVTAGVRAVLQPRIFDDVETVCLFIGHNRSGHSLVGSLLDAHPSMVVAHELDLLRHVRLGFRKRQLFHLIVRTSKAFNDRGRRWSGYAAVVPDQWQGKWRELRIVGDKKGGGTCRELRNHPGLFDELQRRVEHPVRWIHVIRNPFDNISTIYRHRIVDAESLASVIDRYFRNCETVRLTRERVASGDMLDLWHEDLIADPAGELRRICEFLGQNAFDDYLDACTGIVFDTPHRSRHEVDWDPASIARVEQKMAEYPTLSRYGFET